MSDKERFELLMQHIILEFEYGSVVYGTLTEHSDKDIVCIVDDEIDLSDSYNGIWEYNDGQTPETDYQFINENRWIEMVREHHIVWIEARDLPKDKVLVGDITAYEKYFELDKWKLRQVISAIANNAWAKAHKKMTVEKDYDLYRGQKSLFHALRVMIFGRQLGETGHITDYSAANHYWDDIYQMGECGWDVYKEKYKPIANTLRSAMVEVLPKPDGYKMENQNKNKKAKEVKHLDYEEYWRQLK